ncbi:MAG: tRNA (guanosine(46)-N7)-methyltransferase TrmB [Gammaproteobacteria bacterium]
MNGAAGVEPRPLRSFVRREGRCTEAQRRALATLGPSYLVPPGAIDPVRVFGRPAELYLEIGCGAGETLTALAATHPENNYLGIEVYRPGLGRLLQGLRRDAIGNVRLVAEDAAAVVPARLPDASLHGVYVFFPDPWPKPRHHKRRLLQASFLAALRDKLRPQARVFIATDWEDYARQALAAMALDGGYRNLAGPGRYAPRPRWRPMTRYEQHARSAGRRVFDLLFAPS